MGAWIEIQIALEPSFTIASHPTMGAWIEIFVDSIIINKRTVSHPTMGAWIEIVTG